MKVTIVGSGIAGIATAIRLANAGHEVHVFESNAYPGGKLSEITINGYRFDAGPSLFTLPNLVTELFELAGRKPAQHFNYLKLDKTCNYFYEDGTRFTAYSNPQQFADELKQKLGVKPKVILDYLNRSALKYKLTAPLFIEKSLHKLGTYLNLTTLKAILNMRKLHLGKSMNEINEAAFTNKKLVQYFNRFATYNGSNPFRAPGVLTMIPHLEHGIGTFFPEKGMHHITQSLYQLACDLGVTFHFNTPVTAIVTDEDKRPKTVTGIQTAKGFHQADIVISNADIHSTYQRLMPNETHPEKILAQEKSSSALIFYWGINRQYPELDLHNILFSDDYRTEFKHIFNYHSVFYDPTIYINITSKYKADDAPAGCENWFVMINVPYNSKQIWDVLIADARKAIIAKINRILQTNLEEHIVAEDILDPRSIERKTSSAAGALYGNASNTTEAAFFRHKNFSSDIKGLYFCGGSVHPGGGLPLCLNSAKIVASLIHDDYK